jgi:hypothetical protein
MFMPKCIEQNRNNAKARIVLAVILLSDQRFAGWGRKPPISGPAPAARKEE